MKNLVLFLCYLVSSDAILASIAASPPVAEPVRVMAREFFSTLEKTRAQRPKAVQKGLGSVFDSTFEEAQQLLESLLSDIEEAYGTKKEIAASSSLERHIFEKIASVQALLDRLQEAVKNVPDTGLKQMSPINHKILEPVLPKRRHYKKVNRKRVMVDKDETSPHDRSRVHYQIGGSPEDERFLD